MADPSQMSHGDYHPDMDRETHETTYHGFVQFTSIASVVVVCWVLALAVGGFKQAWFSAIIAVILAGVAGFVGARTNLGWKAPAAVLVLLLLMLALY